MAETVDLPRPAAVATMRSDKKLGTYRLGDRRNRRVFYPPFRRDQVQVLPDLRVGDHDQLSTEPCLHRVTNDGHRGRCPERRRGLKAHHTRQLRILGGVSGQSLRKGVSLASSIANRLVRPASEVTSARCVCVSACIDRLLG